MIMVEENISIQQQCEVMSHIARKVDSMNIEDDEIRGEVYADMYNQALRESGADFLEGIMPDYLYATHEAIDCYKIPRVIRERM